MPIKVQSDLPVRAILEQENIFVMDETRALSQNIRPLKIGILNLMPLKEDTELQILRSLSNTPLQLDITFITVSSHESKNTAQSHINKFYEPFCEVKKRRFDGLIITGAPVEQMEFRGGRLLGRAGRDYGLGRCPCYIHFLYLLGSPGGHVSFLWPEEASASPEALRTLPRIRWRTARNPWCEALTMSFTRPIPDIRRWTRRKSAPARS